MELLILGPGRLGSAVVAEAVRAGWPTPVTIGRPSPAGHDPGDLRAGEVVIDTSVGRDVAANIEAALTAGHRSFVIAATGWDADAARVSAALLASDASAVVAPNLSIGCAVLTRLVAVAASMFARSPAVEPFILDWHRRGKVDRPSGTARELTRRILAADPRWAEPDAIHDDRPALAVSAIRAGSAPGMHVVGFDAPGETLEISLVARDRSAYAAGALSAARWLRAEPRAPGFHPFEAVVHDLLVPAPVPA